MSKMAAQGPENTIKVKVTSLQCGPHISDDQYIHFLSCISFFGRRALICGPKSLENPLILLKMAAQGLENTIKGKVTSLQYFPNISDDQYIHFLSCISFFWS
jgi:hypothetical protein